MLDQQLYFWTNLFSARCNGLLITSPVSKTACLALKSCDIVRHEKCKLVQRIMTREYLYVNKIRNSPFGDIIGEVQ